MTETDGVHVDRKKLDELRALERPGNEGFVARILTVFQTDAARRLDEIGLAANQGEPKALAMAAHALKGSAHYVGAHRLAELCREMEELAERGVIDPDSAGRLRQELDAVSEILDREAGPNGNEGDAFKAPPSN